MREGLDQHTVNLSHYKLVYCIKSEELWRMYKGINEKGEQNQTPSVTQRNLTSVGSERRVDLVTCAVRDMLLILSGRVNRPAVHS